MGSTLVPPKVLPDDDMTTRRLEHLAKANAVKTARRVLLARMYQSEPAVSCRMAAEMVEDPPDVLRALDVDEFLRSVARRPVRRPDGSRRSCRGRMSRAAQGWLAAAGVTDVRSLAALTVRQRVSLAAVLRLAAARATA
jgi:hypothetical protein